MSVNPQKARFFLGMLLKKILFQKTSLDRAFSEIVKKYEIGGREARNLYVLSYKVLTYYHSIRFMASYSGFKPRLSNLLEYLYVKNFDIDSVISEVREVAQPLSHTLRLALTYGYPSWFIRDLYGKLPTTVLESILKSLNERKRWLRVNTLKTTTEEAIGCLERTGLRVRQHRDLKEILLVEDAFIKIGNNTCVKAGLVIPQDISSYIATLLIRDIRGDFIDACSAPGLKLIQVMSQNKDPRVISVDISELRARTIPMLVQTSIGNISRYFIVVGDSKSLQFNTRDTTVLIDAPCSNTGAIYADPVVKLHLTKKTLRQLSFTQKSLLNNALKYAHTIYYMTCSIHPLECEEVIDNLMRKRRDEIELVTPIDEQHYLRPFFNKGYMGYEYSGEVYRIYPNVVHGQGFFISIFQVKSR